MSLLLLFPNTRTVMKANRICLHNSLSVRVIPTPHQYSSECGMSIEAADDLREELEELFVAESIPYTLIINTQ